MAEEPGEYRIDDLARAAGTTVRNVRAYQERGLLAPPRREGRIALYDDSHLTRLRLILQLLDRGVTLALIADLIDAWEDGHDLADLLGLEAALVAPWSDDPSNESPATTITADDLAVLFDGPVDAAATKQAVDLGVLEPDGDGYVIRSPRLLRIGADLVQMGVPVKALLPHLASVRVDIEKVARDFVDLAVHHVFADLLAADLATMDVAEMAALVNRLRPIAKAVVDVELSRAMEAAISEQLAEVLQRLGESRGA